MKTLRECLIVEANSFENDLKNLGYYSVIIGYEPNNKHCRYEISKRSSGDYIIYKCQGMGGSPIFHGKANEIIKYVKDSKLVINKPSVDPSLMNGL